MKYGGTTSIHRYTRRMSPGQLARGHWRACESHNHWIRDAHFGEGATRSKKHATNANLAILRVALPAVKAWLLADTPWPRIMERAQRDTSFAYQLVSNHRVK